MNTVNHIVFADFIKDYLISIGVKANRVSVLHHPLPNSVLFDKEVNTEFKNKIYIALGHANDEKLIYDLIKYEKTTHLLEESNIRVILRSQNKYDKLPVSIEIITDYLDEEQYRHYYKIAKGILVLYPDYFRYRFSGVILDAFAAKKIVIGRNIPIVQYFAEKYPSCCIPFTGINDLVTKLSTENMNSEEEIYCSFLKAHSNEIIASQLDEILL